MSEHLKREVNLIQATKFST